MLTQVILQDIGDGILVRQAKESNGEYNSLYDELVWLKYKAKINQLASHFHDHTDKKTHVFL